MHLSYAVPHWCPEDDPDLRSLAELGTGSLVLAWSQVATLLAARGGDEVALRRDLHNQNAAIECVELGEIECESDAARNDLVNELAGRFNTVTSLTTARMSISAGSPTNRNFTDVVAVLRTLAPVARQLGLRLCFRNRFDSSVEQLDELHVLFRDVMAPELRLDFDVGAFQRAVVNSCDAVLSFSGRIGQVRLTDLRGRATVAMGQGDVKVPAVLESLTEERFTGPIVLSVGDAPDAYERLAADQRFLADRGIGT